MNRFRITRRQSVFIFIICTISSKLQTLPCLLAEQTQNNLWLVLLFGALIDIVFFALTITINKLCPNLTIFEILSKVFGKVFAKIALFAITIYFLFKSMLPYEAVRHVFANSLFDSLSWQIFSIFLLFTVGYLAFSGLKTIGRSAELYFVIVMFCVAVLFFLGLSTANYHNILPIFNIDFSTIANSYLTHGMWFGDYMMFFVLMGQIDTSKSSLKFWDILIYAGLIVFYCLGYIAFYCLYTVLVSSQTSLLASISAFSLLNLSIGRLDWFFVIVCQLASIISLSTYLYCLAYLVDQIIDKKHYAVYAVLGTFVIYLYDMLILANNQISIVFYLRFTGCFGIVVQTLLPIFCIFSAIIIKNRSKKTT